MVEKPIHKKPAAICSFVFAVKVQGVLDLCAHRDAWQQVDNVLQSARLKLVAADDLIVFHGTRQPLLQRVRILALHWHAGPERHRLTNNSTASACR